MYAKRTYTKNEDIEERSKYGVFVTQLPPGESFGELSFSGDGNHSRRNAHVISDGNHGDSKIGAQNEANSSDACALLFIPKGVLTVGYGMKKVYPRLLLTIFRSSLHHQSAT